MTRDPTIELLQAMAEVGLRPMRIQWDGVPDGPFHRFPGIGQTKGDNGYYKAFVDQRSAVFGDRRTKERWHWPQDNPKWKAAVKHLEPPSAAEVEKRKREAAEARAKAAERHMRDILDMWARANDCKNHPYLEAKGIRNVSYLKSIIDPETEEETLLIPMVNIQSKIRNIQRIWPNGHRQQMPQAGGSKGLHNTIGGPRFKDTKTVYVCEGWATGWTIHLATNAAVIVVFFDGELKTVGEIIKSRFPEANLIFAADNDRWKLVKREGRMVNPGVYAAIKAAEALDAEYCIPDFPDLATKPTDYDDLRQMTDLETVRKWLVPAMATRAVTMVPPEADEDEEEDEPDEDEPDEDAHWTESFPSWFLGSKGTNYYFLDQHGKFRQVKAFSRIDMLSLAPLDWYREHFGTRTKHGGGVDWDSAMSALIDQGSKSGFYRPDKVRGRGYWPEDGRPLLHLGDRLLLADGTTVAPGKYREGDGIYPALLRLEGPGDDPLRLFKAKEILELFKSFLWEVPVAAYLAAGWTVMAPLCGLLRWRPHIWITGPAGCGITTIIKHLMLPLTGDMGRYASEQGTTEADLRRGLGTDSLPVLIDEPRREFERSTARVDKIIDLMESATTGGRVFRVTPNGKGLSYEIRSMFCLGGVGGAQPDPQCQRRITELRLRHPRELGDKTAQDAHWHQIRREIDRRISPRIAKMLLARAYTRWVRTGRLQKLLAITKSAAGTVLDSNHAADQFGTLFAGAFILLDEKMPDEKSVIATMLDLGLDAYVEIMRPKGMQILDMLFQVREVVSTSSGAYEMSVGKMIALARTPQFDGPEGLLGREDAKRHLRDIGFVLDGGWLYVANQSDWIRETLAGTSFADDHASLLRVMPGAEPGGRRRFAGSRICRTTRIPVKLLDIPDPS